jgi:signal transduction histidine kinase
MTSDLATIDVVVRDGSTVCLRPSTAEDVDALQRFLVSLSTESLYFRFLGLPALTTPRVRALLDNATSTSVIAEAGGRIVAFAGFYRDPIQCGERSRADRCGAGKSANRAKDGSFYWVDTTIVPFLDGAGKPRQYLAIRSDITARKQAEAQLRQQAALTNLGQLTAVVAHEVRNPLAGLRASLQVLERRCGDAGDREIVGTMVRRIDDLNAKVEDLLLDARPKPPRLQAVDVGLSCGMWLTAHGSPPATCPSRLGARRRRS